MKRQCFLVIFISFFISSAVSAQLEKGGWMLGGDLRSGFSTGVGNKLFQFKVSPSVGYMVKNNLVVGTGLLYAYSVGNRASTTALGVAPFIRYYFFERKIRPFVQVDLDLDFAKFTFNDNEFAFKDTDGNVFGRFGLSYFFNENVSADAILNIRITNDGTPAFNDAFTDFLEVNRITFGIGFNFFLPQKSKRKSKEKNIALSERYFQQGNSFWAIQGMLDFYRPQIFGNFNWTKHIGPKFRSLLGADILGIDHPFQDGTINLNIRGGLELFWNYTDDIYGSVLVGGQISSSGNGGLSGKMFPKVHYFFQDAFVELGYNFQFPLEDIFELALGNDIENKSPVSGAIVIAGEYFVKNNLSLRAEFGVNTLQNNTKNVVVFSTVPDNYLTFGINYFFSKEQNNYSEENLYFSD